MGKGNHGAMLGILAALRAEIEAMERRLLESRQYIGQPKVDLEVGWKGEEDT